MPIEIPYERSTLLLSVLYSCVQYIPGLGSLMYVPSTSRPTDSLTTSLKVKVETVGELLSNGSHKRITNTIEDIAFCEVSLGKYPIGLRSGKMYCFNCYSSNLLTIPDYLCITRNCTGNVLAVTSLALGLDALSPTQLHPPPHSFTILIPRTAALHYSMGVLCSSCNVMDATG